MRCPNFVRVANVPGLAAIDVRFDPKAERIECQAKDAPPFAAELGTNAGRAAMAEWVGGVTGDALLGPFQIARAPDVTLTDSSLQTPSLMSVASLRALEEQMGAELDPRRFRGNLWIDGAEPWAELGHLL